MKTNQHPRVPEGQPNAGQFCLTDSEPVKGLTCCILRSKTPQGEDSDCSNGGISSCFDRVTLVGPGVAGVVEPSEFAPAVKLCLRELSGVNYLHAEPVEGSDCHRMFGGTFIHSSDSRFGEALHKAAGDAYRHACPIALHDRTES